MKHLALAAHTVQSQQPWGAEAVTSAGGGGGGGKVPQRKGVSTGMQKFRTQHPPEQDALPLHPRGSSRKCHPLARYKHQHCVSVVATVTAQGLLLAALSRVPSPAGSSSLVNNSSV